MVDRYSKKSHKRKHFMENNLWLYKGPMCKCKWIDLYCVECRHDVQINCFNIALWEPDSPYIIGDGRTAERYLQKIIL